MTLEVEKAAQDGGTGNDSDVEMEGMDLEDDDGVAEENVDMETSPDAIANEGPSTDDEDKGVIDKLAHDDQDELEAARKERMELMAAEQKKVAQSLDSNEATMADKLQYLLSQSEVFAHFLAGTVAAAGAGGKKKGSRGKKNRMTEAEEDAQLLKTAESKRSVIRLDKQVRCSGLCFDGIA